MKREGITREHREERAQKVANAKSRKDASRPWALGTHAVGRSTDRWRCCALGGGASWSGGRGCNIEGAPRFLTLL